MRASPATPGWAVALASQVCADANVRPPARLLWRRRQSEHSTGVTRRTEQIVAVRAGSDLLDQRLTLLHELAHWIAPWPARRDRRRATHHGRAFYEIAFGLYRRYGLTDADALRLEAARYPGALRHAAALGIDGAVAALAERRQRFRAAPPRRWRVLMPEHAIRLERDGRWTVCSVCRQRIVGSNLARLRRARRPAHHVLLTRAV